MTFRALLLFHVIYLEARVKTVEATLEIHDWDLSMLAHNRWDSILLTPSIIWGILLRFTEFYGLLVTLYTSGEDAQVSMNMRRVVFRHLEKDLLDRQFP